MHLGWFVDLNSTMLGRAGGFTGESMERTIVVVERSRSGPLGRGGEQSGRYTQMTGTDDEQDG